jgi:[lysine-biosynthesis-protein LysW]---L-2-aminoadipate ligase
MVRLSILYDVIRLEEKMLLKAARQRNFEVDMIDAKSLTYEVKPRDDSGFFGDIVLQRCVSYFRNFHTTAILESYGLPVINGLNTSTICGNKLLTSIALVKAGVPTPRTIIATQTDAAMEAIKKIGYPAALKPVVGSWGRLISPLNEPESARAILEDRETMFPLYQVYYIQERIKRPPRDIRTVVIGDRVVGAIYRYSPPDDWKTNTARGGKAENCPITRGLEDIILRAAEAVGGGVLGVDCMESPEGLTVHEVNNTIEFKNTVPATGVDIPGLIMDYITQKLKR